MNLTTVSYPGSVRPRFGHRKPQSYTYAPFFPALLYNESQQDFYGGNFWDLRATGYSCRIRRPSRRRTLRSIPTKWVFRFGLRGAPAFPEFVPGSVRDRLGRASVCHPVAAGRRTGLQQAWSGSRERSAIPVHLSKVDRGRSNSTYDQFGLSIAMYEASPEVSPFSSKFDYALANPDKPVLSPDELAGWNLFRGRAMCNTCHLDGTANTRQTTKSRLR